MALPAPTEASSRLRQWAWEIADQIQRASVLAKDGSVVWLRPRSTPDELPAPLGPHLYSGTTGVAMFLAAVDHACDRDDHRQVVLSALAPLRRKLADLLKDPARLRLGLGGFSGLGSLIYSFLHIGSWLADPDLIREAWEISSFVVPERVAQDEQLDVVHGSAGAVLALLALARQAPSSGTSEAKVIEAAVACADHLLEKRVSWEGRPRAWPFYPSLPPSSGFSHGAAGICYALLRLYQTTGFVRYLDAAQEALAFERGLYSPEHRNWRDTRVAAPRYLTMWCHGAPGITLGRLAGLDVLDDPEARQEIEAGLATTRAVPLTDIDHLCCGNFGRADILLYAAGKLGDQTLSAEAREIVRQALDRARRNGGFGLSSPAEGAPPNPTMFNGLAGVGYVLLRLASPESLPCCLCLEPPVPPAGS